MSTILKKNSEGYGYKYTDIAEIHKYLEENDMKYYQEIETNETNGKDYIMTYRYIDGKWEEKPKRGCQVVDAVLSGVKNPAQEQGSALTYARRYSLLMAFGLATDDDDAESLSTITLEKAKKYKITFGQYSGEKLEDIPEDYLEWLSEKATDKYVKKMAGMLLENILPSTEERDEKLKLMEEIQDLCMLKDIDPSEIHKKFKVNDIAEMTIEQMKKCITAMNKKGE